MLKKIINLSYSILVSLAIAISIIYFKTMWLQKEDYTAGLRLEYINVKSIMIFLITAVIIYFVLEKVETKIDCLKIIERQEERNKPTKIFIQSIFSNWVIWGIWFMVYAPGGGMNDTINTIMAPMTVDNCPVIYQMLMWYGMKVLKYLTGSMRGGYAGLVLIQMLICSVVFASVISWLSDKNVKKKVLYILIAYYSFLPVIADYSITLVKDTLFAVFLLKFVILLYDIVESKGEFLKENKNLVEIILTAIGVCCFRSNGAMVCIFSLAITFFVIKKRKKRFLLLLAVVLLTNVGIGHFSQVRFGDGANFRESTGVLMAQIGAVMNDPDAKINQEELEILNKILPVEKWKENYRPSFADTIKFDAEFNNDWLNQNKMTFIKVWFGIMLKNFPVYVKSYICHSYGYWGILPYRPDMSQSYFASINNNTGEDSVWGAFCEENGLVNQSVLPQAISTSLKKVFKVIIVANFIITPGTMIFIVLLCIAILLSKKKYSASVSYLPVVFTWGTMMIASPASLIYRYSYYLVVVLPIIIVTTIMQCTTAETKSYSI